MTELRLYLFKMQISVSVSVGVLRLFISNTSFQVMLTLEHLE